MMRVVLDTNVLLISIPRKSVYRPIYQAVLDGKIILSISNEIIEEYDEVISNNVTPNIAKNIIRLLLELPNVELKTIYYRFNLITIDPDDNKFSDCAITANALYLVSDDKHFNVLKM